MALKELVAIVARALVDDPDGVDVQEIESENMSVVELKVAKDDIGKVIGKEGRTAQSIRALLSAASAKIGRRSQLDIID